MKKNGADWSRVLLPWVRWRLTSAGRASERIPRPTNAPWAHAGGRDSDRILLFGAGLAVGWGVTTHELALPGCVARQVSNRTGRGADVDVVADPDMGSGQATAALEALNLWRYDAIIIVLGVDDAVHFTAMSDWRRRMSELLESAVAGSAEDMRIVVTGIPPIRSISIFDSVFGGFADRHATAMNRETAKLCAAHPRVSFLPLRDALESAAKDGRHRSPETYLRLGGALADVLAPLLDAQFCAGDSRSAHPRAAMSEEVRQQAVDGLGLADSASQARLDHILTLAQRAFNTETVLITVLDRDRQRYLAQAGVRMEEVPRSSAFCDFAIRGRGVMVVHDALEDARVRDNPLVTGDPHIRFYAGFPLELPSGERIGTLCALDSRPRRPADDIDDALLRQFALMAQQELSSLD